MFALLPRVCLSSISEPAPRHLVHLLLLPFFFFYLRAPSSTRFRSLSLSRCADVAVNVNTGENSSKKFEPRGPLERATPTSFLFPLATTCLSLFRRS